jgi:hypothetical protein
MAILHTAGASADPRIEGMAMVTNRRAARRCSGFLCRFDDRFDAVMPATANGIA